MTFDLRQAAADHILIVAHRGVSGGNIPCNTRAAYEIALKQGADMIETDVDITAEAVHEPQSYRWEFNGTELACVSGDNALTKTAGTTTDGVFNKTRYALAKSVVLSHDQPWAVEWKSEGTWKNTSGSGGRMFTSDDVNANYNARYIFIGNNIFGQLQAKHLFIFHITTSLLKHIAGKHA